MSLIFKGYPRNN